MKGTTDPYFSRGDIVSTEFGQTPTEEWDYQSAGMIIWNDSRQEIQWSFNGKDIAGVLLKTERFIALDKFSQSKIWIKKTTAAPAKYRIMAWKGSVA